MEWIKSSYEDKNLIFKKEIQKKIYKKKFYAQRTKELLF
jgi:hypothetical protein